jgi:hypothetical protein
VNDLGSSSPYGGYVTTSLPRARMFWEMVLKTTPAAFSRTETK